MTKLALLSGGKVYLVEEGRDPTTHESRFAKEAESRVERTRSTNSWKDDTEAWNMGVGMMPGMAAFQNAGRPRMSPQFTGVTRGIGNTMCYSMNVFGAGGLFSFDLDKGVETRLMHSNDFNP